MMDEWPHNRGHNLESLKSERAYRLAKKKEEKKRFEGYRLYVILNISFFFNLFFLEMAVCSFLTLCFSHFFQMVL